MSLFYQDEQVTLWHGPSLDVLRSLPDGSVDCCVTSPPYFGLRDYGVDGQYGLEASPAEYVETMRALFAEVRRVLADDGTLWLNLGDSYSTRKIVRDSSHQPGFHPDRLDHDTIGKSWALNASEGNARMPGANGVPEKNLMGMPWRVAFALQDDGWILRNDIIWSKRNAMPESVTDRLSTRHEHVFMFSKSRRYWFDLDPIRVPLERPEALTEGITFGGNAAAGIVGSGTRRRGSTYGQRDVEDDEMAPSDRAASRRARSGHTNKPNSATGAWTTSDVDQRGRNPGDVWTINTQPFPGAHFAVMPTKLAERCIQAGCKPGGVVLDPFSGSATTGLAAGRHGRRYVGIDLNREYLELSLRTRLAQTSLVDGEAS